MKTVSLVNKGRLARQAHQVYQVRMVFQVSLVQVVMMYEEKKVKLVLLGDQVSQGSSVFVDRVVKEEIEEGKVNPALQVILAIKVPTVETATQDQKAIKVSKESQVLKASQEFLENKVHQVLTEQEVRLVLVAIAVLKVTVHLLPSWSCFYLNSYRVRVVFQENQVKMELLVNGENLDREVAQETKEEWAQMVCVENEALLD